MARRFSGSRLVIASHNAGKVAEIADMLTPYGIDAVSAGGLGLAEPEETGSTFRENAAIKALASASASGEGALSDDSGLAVAALGGEPGIHSARWGGPERDFALAMQRVEESPRSSGGSACGTAAMPTASGSLRSPAWAC